MADYFTLISRAINGLPEQNSETRKAVYDRARTALLKQLRGMTPALPEKDVTRERLALEEAIRKLEFNLIRGLSNDTPAEKTPEPPPVTLTPEAEPVKVETVDYEPKGRVKFEHPPEERSLIKKINKPLVFGSLGGALIFTLLALWLLASPSTPVKTIPNVVTDTPFPPPVEKKNDQRIAQDAPVISSQIPQKSPPVIIARDSRSILFEETQGGIQQGVYSEGMIKWKSDKGAILGEFSIPDKKFTATLKITQNKDKTLPASHLLEINIAAGASLKITQIPGFLMKAGEQTRGQPISAQAVKITDTLYLIGLSSIDADITRNVELMKEWLFLDFPIELEGRKRAVITLEKGQDGEKVFSENFAAWGQ